MRFKCVRGGVWIAMGRTPAGERYSARILRHRRREWIAHQRVDGRPVWTAIAPTLAAHRDLVALASCQQPLVMRSTHE